MRIVSDVPLPVISGMMPNFVAMINFSRPNFLMALPTSSYTELKWETQNLDYSRFGKACMVGVLQLPPSSSQLVHSF